MECDTCLKNGDATPLNCSTCARASLYPIRINLATVLLEKEMLGRQIGAIEGVSTSTTPQSAVSGSALVVTTEAAKKHDVERTQNERVEVEERIEMILEQRRVLEKQIEDGKKESSARKAELSRRRSDMTSVTHVLQSRRGAAMETVQKSIGRRTYRLDKTEDRTKSAQSTLCREAALLAGLKQKRRKTKDGKIKEYYTIGGVNILDLRDLNTASPEQISASLTQIARLLCICCTYLSLQTPAEVTLPYNDYPLPTMFTPSASYQDYKVPFPGLPPSPVLNTSPRASRTLTADPRPLPKPRVLCIDRRLPKLVKEDPTVYRLFIEGATFLAWDVAWVCRELGMGRMERWEEICDIGKNMYHLFVAPPPQPAPPMSRASSSKTTTTTQLHSPPARASPARDTSSTPTPSSRPLSTTPITALGSASPAVDPPTSTTWRFASPTRLIDKLKSHLAAEMTSAEWELLDEKEWEHRADEEPVLVGGKKATAEGEETNAVTAAGGDDAEGGTKETAAEQGSKGRGVSGWTKLKSRGNDGK
ncbi:UV radiation resistance protein and autophagy-related subunit 14-domain-containing protein [Cryomyces antarcticus]|nr:hypothetical protein LTR04_006372 [Oleoguttula sp. CCFEE 6159]